MRTFEPRCLSPNGSSRPERRNSPRRELCDGQGPRRPDATRHGAQAEARQAIAALGHATAEVPVRLPMQRCGGRHHHVRRRRTPPQAPHCIGSSRERHQHCPRGDQPERHSGRDEIRTPHFFLRLGGPRQASRKAARWLKVRVHLPHSLRRCVARQGRGDGGSARDLDGRRHGRSPFLRALFAVPSSPRPLRIRP
jgi:hypothetical protein